MASELRLAVIAIQNISIKDREYMVYCVDNDDYQSLQAKLNKVANEDNQYDIEKAEQLLPSSSSDDIMGVYLNNN